MLRVTRLQRVALIAFLLCLVVILLASGGGDNPATMPAPVKGRRTPLDTLLPLPRALPCGSVYQLAEVMERVSRTKQGLHVRALQSIETVFDVRQRVGRQRILPPFQSRALGLFPALSGSPAQKLQALESQQVTTITNLHTEESCSFNEIRNFRPGATRTFTAVDEAEIVRLYTEKGNPTECDFCSVERTSTDTFGRLSGSLTYTAGNVAKLAPWHGLIVSYRHNPLDFDAATMVDVVAQGKRWCGLVHKEDPSYVRCNLICDVGKRASASQVHFHVHVVATQERYAAGFERWRKAARLFRPAGDYTSYWEALVSAHAAAGLHEAMGDAHLLAYLSPTMDAEVVVLAPEPTESFAKAVAHVMTTLRDKGNVRAMSFAMAFPIAAAMPTADIPALFRIMDRGNPLDSRADAGGLEFYATPYVGTDPYKVIQWLRTARRP